LSGLALATFLATVAVTIAPIVVIVALVLR